MIGVMTCLCRSSSELGSWLGLPAAVISQQRGPGGPVDTRHGPVFLKPLASLDQAQAEQDGLAALAGGAFRVPRVLAVAALDDGGACLVLEWLALQAPPAAESGRVADALADWYQRAHATAFGWHRDNYIGPTPQPNRVMEDWGDFFAHQRLQPQLDLAEGRLGRATCERVEAVIGHVRPLLAGAGPPVRLHGDLWRGNLAWVEDQPALFDPAVYHGPAEVDLAMLELFGEPLPGLVGQALARLEVAPGYPVRRQVYHLYHLLNHFNLFGAGYARAVDETCGRLLAEVRA